MSAWPPGWRCAGAFLKSLSEGGAWVFRVVRNVTQLARYPSGQTVLSNSNYAGSGSKHMAGNTEERSKPAADKVPAPGGDTSMGSGTRTILSTMPEVRDASLKVAKSAQRLLSIFTQDLEPLVYGEEPFLEAIKRLVLARSYAKVRV